MTDFGPADAAGAADDATYSDSLSDAESGVANLLSQEGDSFQVSREQAQKWNRELGNYRQKWGKVARDFDGIDPEDTAQMAQWLRSMNDPATRETSITWMRGVLDGLSPKDAAKAEAAIKEEAAEQGVKPQALTKEDVDRAVAAAIGAHQEKQDREAFTRDFIAKVNTESKRLAEEYGIEELGDPASPLHNVLLSTAQQTEGDKIEALGKAAAKIAADLEKAAQKFVSKKTAGAGGPAVAQKGGEPGGQKPKTFADAKRSAQERISAMPGR